jgi:hypothetical protein
VSDTLIESLYDAEEALESCTSFVSFDHSPDGTVTLDGEFTVQHLRALIYIIEHPIVPSETIVPNPVKPEAMVTNSEQESTPSKNSPPRSNKEST